MPTQTQFNALGAALDADITALQAHLTAQDNQIAALQEQLASGSGQLTGTQEDEVLVMFQAIADRVHSMLP